MALRFAQADVLPFDYSNYAKTIVKHVDDLEKLLKGKFLNVDLDLTPVKKKAQEWQEACEALERKIQSNLAANRINPDLNQILMQMERDLVEAKGLPGREWFRHRIYAPGFYTGYASKPLPGVAEPAEDGDWNAARKELSVLLGVLDRVIQTTRRAKGT